MLLGEFSHCSQQPIERGTVIRIFKQERGLKQLKIVK